MTIKQAKIKIYEAFKKEKISKECAEFYIELLETWEQVGWVILKRTGMKADFKNELKENKNDYQNVLLFLGIDEDIHRNVLFFNPAKYVIDTCFVGSESPTLAEIVGEEKANLAEHILEYSKNCSKYYLDSMIKYVKRTTSKFPEKSKMLKVLENRKNTKEKTGHTPYTSLIDSSYEKF